MNGKIDTYTTDRPLTDKEIFELKVKLNELYRGVRYTPKPFESRLFCPIVPKGFLSKYFGRL